MRKWIPLAIGGIVAALPVHGPATEPAEEERWVAVQRLVSETDVPVIGKVRSDTWVVALVDLRKGPDRVAGQGPICAMWVDGPPLVKTVLPDAFRRAVSPFRVDAKRTVNADTEVWTQGIQWAVHGATVRDAQKSPLPQASSDGRVSDPDGDGSPGLTVQVRGIVDGDVHVIHRGGMGWTTTANATGTHAGGVSFEQEQVVLGATSRWLESPLSPQPRADLSRIWLEQVSETSDCAKAKTVARTLRRAAD
jgi:hypothetical protein